MCVHVIHRTRCGSHKFWLVHNIPFGDESHMRKSKLKSGDEIHAVSVCERESQTLSLCLIPWICVTRLFDVNVSKFHLQKSILFKKPQIKGNWSHGTDEHRSNHRMGMYMGVCVCVRECVSAKNFAPVSHHTNCNHNRNRNTLPLTKREVAHTKFHLHSTEVPNVIRVKSRLRGNIFCIYTVWITIILIAANEHVST